MTTGTDGSPSPGRYPMRLRGWPTRWVEDSLESVWEAGPAPHVPDGLLGVRHRRPARRTACASPCLCILRWSHPGPTSPRFRRQTLAHASRWGNRHAVGAARDDGGRRGRGRRRHAARRGRVARDAARRGHTHRGTRRASSRATGRAPCVVAHTGGRSARPRRREAVGPGPGASPRSALPRSPSPSLSVRVTGSIRGKSASRPNVLRNSRREHASPADPWQRARDGFAPCRRRLD